MARLSLPTTAVGNQQLLKDVTDKDTADGALSVIKPFMTQNGISLADDKTAIEAAVALEILRDKTTRDAEKHTTQRNQLFSAPWKMVTASAQFLKKFYVQMPANLNLWGIPITVKGRVNYPSDFTKRATIFKNIKEKHDSYAPETDSPLYAFLQHNNYDLAALLTMVEDATTAHHAAETLHEQAEGLTVDLRLKLSPVRKHLTQIGNFLISINLQNPKDAGDWGYEVNHSPCKPTLRKTSLIPLNKRTIKNVVLGGSIENKGTDSVSIYRGGKIKGTPIILLPGNKFLPTKGYSTITIVNTSSTEKAIIHTILSQ